MCFGCRWIYAGLETDEGYIGCELLEIEDLLALQAVAELPGPGESLEPNLETDSLSSLVEPTILALEKEDITSSIPDKLLSIISSIDTPVVKELLLYATDLLRLEQAAISFDEELRQDPVEHAVSTDQRESTYPAHEDEHEVQEAFDGKLRMAKQGIRRKSSRGKAKKGWTGGTSGGLVMQAQ